MNAVHLEIVGQNCHMICEMCCSRLFGCNSYGAFVVSTVNSWPVALDV